MANKRLNREERKQQIRDISKKVFLEKGFRNTVMNDIMEATGLSRGGLYHHYGSTNEILYDIMDQGNKEREDRIKKKIELRNDLSLKELFAEIIVDKMLADNDSIEIYAMFLQQVKEDAALKELYEKLKDKSIRGILSLLKENQLESFVSSLHLITDLINSVILSCEILDVREDFLKNRDRLEKMIVAVLGDEEKI